MLLATLILGTIWFQKTDNFDKGFIEFKESTCFYNKIVSNHFHIRVYTTTTMIFSTVDNAAVSVSKSFLTPNCSKYLLNTVHVFWRIYSPDKNIWRIHQNPGAGSSGYETVFFVNFKFVNGDLYLDTNGSDKGPYETLEEAKANLGSFLANPGIGSFAERKGN